MVVLFCLFFVCLFVCLFFQPSVNNFQEAQKHAQFWFEIWAKTLDLQVGLQLVPVKTFQSLHAKLSVKMKVLKQIWTAL